MTTETKETYNGWSNYATWRVNLEMVDVDDLDGETFASIYNLADSIQENVENYIETECDNGREGVNFAHSYALAFLSDVNWYEIAKHVAKDYPSIIKSNE